MQYPQRRTTNAPQRNRNGQQEEPDVYDDRAGFRIARIARRYDGVSLPDGVLYRQGNKQIYVHNSSLPIQRASRTTEEPPIFRRKPRRRFHWLFFVGIVFLVMILGYVGLNAFGAWWQIHTDDGTYGRPRTFQIDAVVGHSDSATHPTHFIAENLNRHIIIIEIPGGDVSKSLIYSGPVLMGGGQDLTPVTLTFSDMNGDGKGDMLLHILDQTIVFLNNGTKFVPPSTLIANGGSNPPIRGD